MTSEAVRRIFNDFNQLTELLRGLHDFSGMTALEETYPKALLLASASHLEVTTTAAILDLWSGHQRTELQTFVERKSLTRNFHSLFNWTDRKANQFFGLFGTECGERFKARMQADETFARCVNSFLEIGDLRNQLVHRNYAEFSLTKTAEEILELDGIASQFPSHIKPVVFDEDRSGHSGEFRTLMS